MNTPSDGQALVFLTENAAKRVSDFATKEPNSSKKLRIYVEGGGCSGFSYGFSFDAKKDSDILVKSNGLEILLDSQSLEYIKGSTVDFIDDFQGTGFKVTNPNATGTCGCGVSFSV